MKMKLIDSHWYEYKPGVENLFTHFDKVQAACGDNVLCYMDSVNYSVMDKTELTAAIYQFISHRAAVIRWGFENNFLGRLHFTLDFIDWDLVLDCITGGLL